MSIAHLPPGGPDSPAPAQASRWIATLRRGWCSLAGDHAGVTSLEYAIMGSLVCAAIAASVIGFTGGLGGNMAGTFARIAATM